MIDGCVESAAWRMNKMEIPGFEIKYKIEKEWLEDQFRDLEKDIKVTDEMIADISNKMEAWIWKIVLKNQYYIGDFWEDQNDALYEIIKDIK